MESGSVWHLSPRREDVVSKALKRAMILRVTLHVSSILLKVCFPSFSHFSGPPPEFCKSENPEKEKKEGVL